MAVCLPHSKTGNIHVGPKKREEKSQEVPGQSRVNHRKPYAATGGRPYKVSHFNLREWETVTT